MTHSERRKFAGLLVLDVLGRLLLLAVAVGASLGMVTLWVVNPPLGYALIPALMCVVVVVAVVALALGTIFVRPMCLKYLNRVRPHHGLTKNSYLR